MMTGWWSRWWLDGDQDDDWMVIKMMTGWWSRWWLHGDQDDDCMVIKMMTAWWSRWWLHGDQDDDCMVIKMMTAWWSRWWLHGDQDDDCMVIKMMTAWWSRWCLVFKTTTSTCNSNQILCILFLLKLYTQARFWTVERGCELIKCFLYMVTVQCVYVNTATYTGDVLVGFLEHSLSSVSSNCLFS